MQLSAIMALMMFTTLGCSAAPIGQFAGDRARDSNSPLIPDVRDRWLKILIETEDEFPNPDDIPGYRELLLSYVDHVVSKPWNRGKMSFVILNEEGKPLRGVRVEYPRITGFDGRLEPTGERETLIVDGATTIRLGKFSTNLYLYKAGHRNLMLTIGPSQHYEPGHKPGYLHQAESLLREGYMLPPEKEGGPVRIVMPYLYDWDPGDRSRWNDSHDINPPAMKLWPKSIDPAQSRAVLTFDPDKPEQRFTVRERGTYVLTDSGAKCVMLVRAEPGHTLALSSRYIVQHSLVGASHHRRSYNLAGSLPAAGGPYTWYFYTPATRRVHPGGNPTTSPTSRPSTEPAK